MRSVFVLGDDTKPVHHKGRQFAVDIVTSVIAAGGLYFLVVAYEAWQHQPIPHGFRIPAALVAGWTRRSFVGWLATLVEAVGDVLLSRFKAGGKKTDGDIEPRN